MGLFDFFKRRSKEEKKVTPKPAEEQVETPAAPEPTPESKVDDQGPAKSEVKSVPEAESASETETAPETASETETEAVSETETEAVSETETEAVSETETEAVSETETEAVSETETEAISETETEAASETETEAASETETEAASETETEAASETEPEPEPITEQPVAETQPDQPVTTDADRYDKGLAKSRMTFGERFNHLLANFRHVDESFFDDLEETLIGADVGFEMAMQISEQLRDEVKLQNAKKPKDVQNVVVQKLIEIYDAAGAEENNQLTFAKEGLTVILFVGVNGVGKTTTIGKMANRFKQQGKKVLLAAADTFRAGAIEQLNVWAERDGVDIVKKPEKSDPSAVVFDALKKAKAENYDILFVDTAGRLQNKSNLMNELAKMKRVISREVPEAPHEVLLVLDATTGQNALTQAKMFKETTDVTGIVLTKLDGTARGGIVLAIRNELHLPVKYVGLGEQVDDLRPFEPSEFIYGLFKGLIDV